MRKIRTLIVDDEPLAREGIRMLLRDDSEIAITGECGDGSEAVERIIEEGPDLVFLDVQMPEMNGFDVLDQVGTDAMPSIIFVTAFDKYALQAFEADAIDYLLKPFTRERFFKALEKAKTQIRVHGIDESHERPQASIEDLDRRERYLDRIVVKSAGRIFFLDVRQIDWIEAADTYVRLHSARESHLVRGTMSRLEAKLDPNRFLRVHRSIIVNLERVKEFHPLFHGEYAILLHDATQLTSGRSYRNRLQLLLENLF